MAKRGRVREPSDRPVTRGSGKLTSREIALLSGVSQSTVSRVVRGYPHVSDAARERVLRTLKATGYRPNAAARTMRTRLTGVIGVVVGRVTNPFYPQLIDALSEEISGAEHQMNLWISDHGGEPSALSAIHQGAVDGVIYTTVTANSSSLSEAIHQGAPIVLLNRTLPDPPCDKVSSDNREGGARIARYFLSHGHERLGLIAGPVGISTGGEREEGYRSALREHGTPLRDELCVRGEFSHASGHAGMIELLRQRPAPTAVFCVNDVIAFGAIDAARAQGASVPDDLWVVGYDDIDLASWEAFSLTTVRQPVRDMARLGVRMLLERLEGGDAAAKFRHERLPGELVIRNSTAGRA